LSQSFKQIGGTSPLDFLKYPDIYNQLSMIMQFNRSFEPTDGCRQATRTYNDNGDVHRIGGEAGAGFALDLHEPRPLASPEKLFVVTDPIKVSMLQLGFHMSAKDHEASFSPMKNIPSHGSIAKRRQSRLASALWYHLNTLQYSNTRTNTVDHHDVAIHASRLPPPQDNSHNMTAVTPRTSSSSEVVVEIQDCHLRLESMPSGEWSVGSKTSDHDCCLFKKSASLSSFASSYYEPPRETKSVDYYSQSDENWMEKYQELQAFFRVHNHSNVPSIFPENQALANWVKRTRGQYKLFHRTSQNWHRSTMTRERAAFLSGVDFQTNLRARSWQQQYEKLVSFQDKHGHVRVLSRDDPSLCYWIKRQRKLCRDFANGEGSMTAERIQKLILVDSL
jgi:Helicase associated domain